MNTRHSLVRVVVVLSCVLPLGCGKAAKTPEELLKVATDAKIKQLKEFFESRGVKAAFQPPQFEEEKNLNIRLERPYIGKVKFDYQVEPEKNGGYQISSQTLRWDYLKKENRWVFTGCERFEDVRPDALVKWSEIAALIRE